MGAPGLDGFRSQAASCPYRTSPAVLSELVALIGVNAPISVFRSESADLPAPVLLELGNKLGTASQRGPPLG